MVLIQARGQGLCLECHERFRGGDEAQWLARHLGPDGCTSGGQQEPVPDGCTSGGQQEPVSAPRS